jgi:hypothetical protein
MKFDAWTFFEKSVEKIQVSLNSDKNNGSFTWRCFRIYDYLENFFLECEMFWTKVVEKIKTHFMINNSFPENRTVYETMSKNVVNSGDTNDVAIWRICFAWWKSKATCTYAHAHTYAPGYPHARTHRPISSNYCHSTATMIRERASMLRRTYIACLV